MKKILVAVLTLSIFVGCSSGIDEEAAKKLSTDLATQDFILDGVVYELSDPLSKFYDNGWESERIDVSLDEVALPADQIAKLELVHNKYKTSLSIVVYNETESEVTLASDEAKVMTVQYLPSYNGEDVAPFVTKGGITNEATYKKASKALTKLYKDEKGATISDEDNHYGLHYTGKDGNELYISFFQNKGDTSLTAITIGNESILRDKLDMELPAEAEEKIKETKEKYTYNEASYSSFTNNNTEKYLVHLTLEIISLPDDLIYVSGDGHYLAKDSLGNIYAIKDSVGSDGRVPWTQDFSVGSTIDIWASTNSTIHITVIDSDNIDAPILEANIIEKNGELIYRDLYS